MRRCVGFVCEVCVNGGWRAEMGLCTRAGVWFAHGARTVHGNTGPQVGRAACVARGAACAGGLPRARCQGCRHGQGRGVSRRDCGGTFMAIGWFE